jgi:hypothetical protein
LLRSRDWIAQKDLAIIQPVDHWLAAGSPWQAILIRLEEEGLPLLTERRLARADVWAWRQCRNGR